MTLYRKCIQSLLIKSCGSSWWELYRVKYVRGSINILEKKKKKKRFVRGTILVVVVTSHPNIVQFRFPIILPATNYA